MDAPRIVVGVDGSLASLAALRWAALEAQRRGVELEVMLAYNWQVPGVPRAAGLGVLKEAVDFASSLVDAAVTEARTVAPRARVHGTAVVGKAALTLAEAAKQADLLVVGHRGGGGFTGLLASSVSIRVATHAPCPVVVVRGNADNDTGPVIVGVDGSESADLAIATAFDEASRLGSSLMAVRAYTLPPMPVPAGPIGDYDLTAVRADLRTELVEQLAGWCDKYPDVPVEYVLQAGNPAGVLTTASRHGQLVVVGTRGHGAASGLLLGSVGLQLLHHAECPVLIARVPAHTDETAKNRRCHHGRARH